MWCERAFHSSPDPGVDMQQVYCCVALVRGQAEMGAV